MLTEEHLKKIGINLKFLEPLNKWMERYEINTTERKAHFLAQVCHESNNLKVLVENLNYSSDALGKLFGKYFRSVDIKAYHRKPEMIANRIYSNRMGNGDEKSGDGWKFRGRGGIQLTGKDNYALFSKITEINIVENPDYLLTDDGAIHGAGWFWNKCRLNNVADFKTVKDVTLVVNGGTHGLEDRIARYTKIKDILLWDL